MMLFNKTKNAPEWGRFFVCLDSSAKGHQSKGSQLKALLAKGNTDNGDAPNDTGNRKAKRDAETTEYKPDQVCNGMLAKIGVYLLTKGEEGKLSQFEGLLAEGNTDDGDAPENAQEEPGKTCTKAGKEEPKNVTQSFHNKSLLYRKIFWVNNNRGKRRAAP